MLSPELKKRTSDLAGKLVEEIISDTEFSELEELILDGPESAGWYQKSIRLHLELQEMARVPIPLKPPPPPKRRAMVSSPKNRGAFWQTMAAMLVICVSVFWILDRAQSTREIAEVSSNILPTEQTVIGSVYRVSGNESNWKRGQEFTTGENIVNATRVEFLIHGNRQGQNSIVAVQGPAKFSFITPQHFRLYSGRMTAEIPKPYIGFKVSTDDTEVIDLGTRFAVTANGSDDSAVHVYEGKIMAQATDAVARSKTLTANQTARFNPYTREFDSIRYEQTMFAAAPVQSGLIEWHSSGVNVVDKQSADFDLLSPNIVQIFRESSRLTLAEDLTVDILTLADGKSLEPGVIPEGTRVSTYMLTFVTDNSMTTPPAEVRFETRILGINGRVSNEKTGPFAGFDRIPPAINSIEATDTVEVKADGRTLRTRLEAANGTGDFLRIIVAED